MTTHWITECPHCDTSFRVTEQHLRAAKGSVRCGSCLQIFNAIDTLFPGEETESAAKTTTPAYSPITPPPDTPAPTPFIEDTADDELTDAPAPHNRSGTEVVESDNDEQLNPRRQWEDEQEQFTDESAVDELGTNESTDLSDDWKDDHDYLADFDTPVITAPELDTPLFEAPDLDADFLKTTVDTQWNYEEDTADGLATDIPDDTADVTNEDAINDDAADDVTNNEDDITTEDGVTVEDGVTDDDILEEEKSELTYVEDAYGEELNDEEIVHDETEIETFTTHSDDVDSFDVAQDATPEPDMVVPEEPSAPTQPTTPSYNDDDFLLVGGSHVPNQYALQSEDVYQTRRDDERGHDWQILLSENEPHIGPYRAPFRDELLSELEAEPPRGFQWHEANTPLRTKVLWWGLNGLLVLTLGTQYVLSHYNDFAETLQAPPFNALINTLCKTTGCGFIKTDLSLVANENLIIRMHPTQNGFVVLDTMMTNRASFEQPFPLLDLSFSDIKDKIIARRVFKPSEYLSGDLANAASMPSNTPLHISFVIKNPSESATNYRLKLIPTSR